MRAADASFRNKAEGKGSGMDLGVRDKVFALVGGTSGMAHGAAKVLAQDGARIAMIGRSRDKGEPRARALAEETGADVRMYVADGTKKDVMDQAINQIAADFGRRLDYYTGFVFEIHDSRRPGARQIVGGGRYDRMLGLILNSRGKAKGEAFPPVGFSIWLDRIGAAA